MNIPSLRAKVTRACAIPAVTKTLLSMPPTCDEGGDECFKKKEVHVTNKGNVVLEGKRGASIGSQIVSTGPPESSHSSIGKLTNKRSKNLIAVAIDSTRIKKDMVRFFFNAFFYPIKSAWMKEVENRNHATFPGLNATLVY